MTEIHSETDCYPARVDSRGIPLVVSGIRSALFEEV
jgi:hypothetical protein